ncbi:protein kinase domain-containing protein [Yinghuangia sp. YIM S10712]|uniref:serine/threonine-protein kinase n=1 Tax=Yinghuangia sp. YIM S10712 TaxID=3436930 RepID=UPI003F53A100
MGEEDARGRRRVCGGLFELVEPLGNGAMGTVWRAVDTTLRREVALKEVRAPEGATDEESATMRSRAIREAQALARLRNPHVATVHHIQITEGEPFPWIVMELVPGRSLASVLADGPLPPEKAAGIGRDILDALSAAHGAGVLHRDVKPANVLVRPDGTAVLVDFGIASVEGAATVTVTGSLLGTLEYVAPERTDGHPPTPASDLWSLGVLLYVAVEGTSPFRRPNHWATLAAIHNDPHPPPRRAGPLAPVIDALLEKDPRARPGAEQLTGWFAAITGTGGSASGSLEAPATSDSGGGTDTGTDVAQPGSAQVASSQSRSVHPGALPPPPGASGIAAAPTVSARPSDTPTVHAHPAPDTRPRPAAPTPTAAGGPPPRPTGPPTVGGNHAPPPDGSRRRLRNTLVSAGVAGLLAAGAITAYATLGGGDGDDRAGNASTPSATTARPSSVPPTADPGGSSAIITGPSAPTAPPSVPPTTASTAATPTAPVLPPGYEIRTHPDGFQVAVPRGWRQTQDAQGRSAYESSDGTARLVVVVLRGDSADPMTEQRRSAAESDVAYPGYQQIALAEGSRDGGPEATWEYTYRPAEGARHIKDVRWRVGGTSYNLWISAPDGPAWPQYAEQLAIALEHFRDTRKA